MTTHSPKPVLLISLSRRGPLAKLHAACDITVVNLPNPSLILGAISTVGHAGEEKEFVKSQDV